MNIQDAAQRLLCGPITKDRIGKLVRLCQRQKIDVRLVIASLPIAVQHQVRAVQG